MHIRQLLVSCALGAALSVAIAPRTAAAQGSEASGVGVGVQGMLTSATEIPTGVDTFVDVPVLAGPAVTYQTPKFHVDGILSYGDDDSVTVLGVGGRFYYELHSTQASDLSVGGGIGFMSVDFGIDSDSAILFEAGGKIRAFLAPSVAVNASLGLGYIAGLADRDYILFGGQLVGAIGVTYFFF
jgi:hypothetical protein